MMYPLINPMIVVFCFLVFEQFIDECTTRSFLSLDLCHIAEQISDNK